jgi:hypothetical protein
LARCSLSTSQTATAFSKARQDCCSLPAHADESDADEVGWFWLPARVRFKNRFGNAKPAPTPSDALK